MSDEITKDVFICHASEDKEKIARPLAEALGRAGISYWYDDAEVEWGGSITARVSEGLRKSRYVLVILSPASMSPEKHWPYSELLAALNEEASTGENKVLPLLAGSPQEQKVIADQIHDQLYLLTSKKYISWDGNPSVVVNRLRSLLGSTAVGRVWHVSSEYPPHVLGGLGVHVEKLTGALGSYVDVTVILPSLNAVNYEVSYEHVHPLALANVAARYEEPVSWLRFAGAAARRVMLTAKTQRPDVIHCHDWVTALAGIKCRWSLGIPLVFHLHLPNRNPFCASVENLGLICADLITINSPAMFQELEDRHLDLRRKSATTRIIKNGVDQQIFHPPDAAAVGNYILCVGRLVEQKGMEYLIRAFFYVREKFPDLHLKIVGDGELKDAHRKLAESLLLSDRVEFLGWRQPGELAALYGSAAAVVVPSTYEPFGMTALEAMACQRPVVASRIGGLQDLVEDQVTGFLAEPGDELDLAQRLMALLSDPERARRMGEVGQARVSSGGYTWPEIAQQYVGLYEELVSHQVDRTVAPAAAEFIDQIITEAQKISPEQASASRQFLEELFEGGNDESSRLLP
jgi:glycosyltransferase involved in cell wall biosynthesis